MGGTARRGAAFWREARRRCSRRRSSRRRNFPSRPMTWVVPFPAGGTTDLLARIFAQKLTEAFGQSVVVENTGGGGGSIGADKVAKAAPDGYTLLLHNVTFSTTTTSLMATGRAKHTFDDFTPVSLAANVPLIVMCHPIGAGEGPEGVRRPSPRSRTRPTRACSTARPGRAA